MALIETPFEKSNMKFRVVAHVTRPLIKQEDGKPVYIKFESAMKQSEDAKWDAATPEKRAELKMKQPPTLANVINLETGHPSQYICNEVLKSELQKNYKEDGYVGKLFEVTRNAIAGDKRYATYGITELAEVKDEEQKDKTKK